MHQATIKEAALTGFAKSSAYDTYRPSYPDEAVEQLLSAVKISGIDGASVGDLAAGTGKFTERLAARPEKYSIVAIEPHDGMRAVLEEKELGGVQVVKGSAENMADVAEGTFQALIASQAFHWFANQHALKEIYRVLKPAGVLGMIWNIEDYNAPRGWPMATKWESIIHNLTWTFEDDNPRFRHNEWRKCFDDQLASGPLSLTAADPMFSLPLGEGSVRFETWLSRDDIWKRYRTLSQIAILDGPAINEVRKTFFDALNQDDVVEDDLGRVAVHGQTFFAWTSRIPGQPLEAGG